MHALGVEALLPTPAPVLAPTPELVLLPGVEGEPIDPVLDPVLEPMPDPVLVPVPVEPLMPPLEVPPAEPPVCAHDAPATATNADATATANALTITIESPWSVDGDCEAFPCKSSASAAVAYCLPGGSIEHKAPHYLRAERPVFAERHASFGRAESRALFRRGVRRHARRRALPLRRLEEQAILRRHAQDQRLLRSEVRR